MSANRHAKKHECFDELVDFGDAAIPWALERLKSSIRWTLVLEEITGEVPEAYPRWDVDAIRTAWLRWRPHEPTI